MDVYRHPYGHVIGEFVQLAICDHQGLPQWLVYSLSTTRFPRFFFVPIGVMDTCSTPLPGRASPSWQDLVDEYICFDLATKTHPLRASDRGQQALLSACKRVFEPRLSRDDRDAKVLSGLLADVV
jgi:hypothetical protein